MGGFEKKKKEQRGQLYRGQADFFAKVTETTINQRGKGGGNCRQGSFIYMPWRLELGPSKGEGEDAPTR